ncbi:ATP-binding protein [Ferrimonas balearica]|uniref:ATP-binding protein n=1 Tax=Ferrimonas balearica TaxID=44012 RepID=UPI001C994B34|nr:transporter substrate-binding domain-containing protein [Ferrimonas balearica]MBY5991501.1 transporter substrate-binding domain-containing protein [Ferrimonas balearica]
MKRLFCLLALMLTLPAHAQTPAEPIVLGVHSHTPPFEWRQNGLDTGLHVELMQRLGKRMGREVQVRRHNLQTLLNQLDAQEIDLLVAVSPVDRPRAHPQSDPIFTTFAKAYSLPSQPYITDWAQLAGMRIAVKTGSFVDVFLAGQEWAFDIVPVDLYETGFQMLQGGQVDLVIAEQYVARRLQPRYDKVHSASDPLIYGSFTYVSYRGNQALITAINQQLRQMKISGEYDRLLNQWLGVGREKVDLEATQNRYTQAAFAVAILSMIGMLVTWRMSRGLKARDKELRSELRQRRKAESGYAMLSRQFQSVLDGLPHGIVLYEADRTRLWGNDKANAFLSIKQQLTNDQGPLDLDRRMGQVIKHHRPWMGHYRDQANRHWEIQCHPLLRKQVVVMGVEITEQVLLRQENEKASRLASLGELSAGVAHEINNPTGLILQSVALLSDALEDLAPAWQAYEQEDPFWQIAGLPPARAMMELAHSQESIGDSARRISTIVSDLKRYAQPDQDQPTQEVDLNAVVATSLRLTTNQHKAFEVTTELCPALPAIQAQQQAMEQVLINLIQNACLALPQQEGRLKLTTGVTNGRPYLEVADNGHGMSDAVRERITEPFFTTRRAEGGTGLGMAVCARILAEHHAQMTIDSAPGQGTRIRIHFAQEALA